MLIWVLQSSQCSKIREAQHWGRRGAHLSENKGMKSESKKFEENSRETASVSTIYDEYCSLCFNNLPATTQRCHSCTEYSIVKKARIVEYLGKNIVLGGNLCQTEEINTASDVTRACGSHQKRYLGVK